MVMDFTKYRGSGALSQERLDSLLMPPAHVHVILSGQAPIANATVRALLANLAPPAV